MTLVTKDLGLVKAINVGPIAPINTSMLWNDSNIVDGTPPFKFYNQISSSWELLSSGGGAVPIQYQNVAFVDGTYGDDSIAIIGRPDKPFFSINSAIATLQVLNIQALVWVRPGEYNEVVNLADQIHLHFDPETNLPFGGFSDQVNGAVNVRITGHLNMIAPGAVFCRPLTLSNSSNIYFEFCEIDTEWFVGSFVITTPGDYSNVVMKGKKIKITGQGGFGFTLRGAISLRLDVFESIEGTYRLFDIRDGYSGISEVNCSNIKSNGALGSLPSYSQAVYSEGNTGNGMFTVNGNIEMNSSILAVGGNILEALVVSSGCNIRINGDLIANNFVAIRGFGSGITSSTNEIHIIHKSGKISSIQEAIHNQGSGMKLLFEQSYIQGASAGDEICTVLIESGTQIYMKDCSIINIDTGTNIIVALNSTAVLARFYNCLAYSPNAASGNFVFLVTGTLDMTFHNVMSNKDNSVNITNLLTQGPGLSIDSQFIHYFQ